MFSSTSSFFSSFFGSTLASFFSGAAFVGAGAASNAPNCLILTSASKLIAAMFLNPLRRWWITESSLRSPTYNERAAKLLTPFLNF